LIVDVHGDPRNNIFMYLLKGKLRVGFSIRGLGFLLTHKAKFYPDAHIIDRYFETVKVFGGINIPDELGFEKWENKKNNKVCIHPGTGLPIKQWSIDGWAKVADYFISSEYDVVLIGTEDEQTLLNKIRDKMEYSNLVKLDSIKNIGVLSARLSECDLFISTDTGPAHLAHIKGTPQLQLFGPSMAKRWGYENICSIECECLNELECKYGFENRCMIKLQPETVIKKAEEVLNGT
jgi:ADP-heptose:LPS heptosyltransferase